MTPLVWIVWPVVTLRICHFRWCCRCPWGATGPTGPTGSTTRLSTSNTAGRSNPPSASLTILFGSIVCRCFFLLRACALCFVLDSNGCGSRGGTSRAVGIVMSVLRVSWTWCSSLLSSHCRSNPHPPFDCRTGVVDLTSAAGRRPRWHQTDYRLTPIRDGPAVYLPSVTPPFTRI